MDTSTQKRGPGRPKGSTNKPNEQTDTESGALVQGLASPEETPVPMPEPEPDLPDETGVSFGDDEFAGYDEIVPVEPPVRRIKGNPFANQGPLKIDGVDRKKWHCRWVKDIPGRVNSFRARGFVPGRGQNSVGMDTRAGSPRQVGSVISREGGGGERLVFMMQPMEMHLEEEARKASRYAQAKQQGPGPDVDGALVTGNDEGFYTPKIHGT